MTSLRQRIRKTKISCQPWKQYRGEINSLCVSGQCLFSNKGLPWYILEIELKTEGWLTHDESLWDVLTSEQALKRSFGDDIDDDCMFNDGWTEKDYEHFYNNLQEGI